MTFILISITLASLMFAVRSHRAFKSLLQSFQALHASYLSLEKSHDAWKDAAFENKDLVKHNFDAHWDHEVHRATLDSPFSQPRCN